MSVVGARPQFIKLWPLAEELASDSSWDHLVVHTGQHYDVEMSDVFFNELGMPAPDFKLDHGGGGHGAMTGAMLADLEQLYVDLKPDAVIVFGDTNSTLAGALAAAKLDIPIAHIEAGLRSRVRSMPEEINRVLTDHISARLLCPTSGAVENLNGEGITDGVVNVGDIMYDASRLASERSPERAAVRARFDLDDDPYAVVTLHRAALTDDRHQLADALDWLKSESTDRRLVWPIHPRTAAAIERFGLSTDPITVIPPASYLDMAGLLANAERCYTDSGGLQKEAYFHRVPCVTLRDETEWTETIDAGWNRLWRTPAGDQPVERREISEYGDGHSARLIVDELATIGSSTTAV